MRTEENSFLNDKSKHRKLKYYEGNLYEYANDILTRGRGGGTVCRICEIVPAISEDMRTKGVELISKDIIITQRQIFKYRKHPKTTKGANIPVEDYALIESALKKPLHIYEDTVQKRLVYVCTHPYHDNRFVKVVVEPNYRNRGVVVNLAKSWGIVEKNKMKGIQYRPIQ